MSLTLCTIHKRITILASLWLFAGLIIQPIHIHSALDSNTLMTIDAPLSIQQLYHSARTRGIFECMSEEWPAETFRTVFQPQLELNAITEQQILRMYDLYPNPGFMAYISTFPGFNDHMRSLFPIQKRIIDYVEMTKTPNGAYAWEDSSGIGMSILGIFFGTEIGCNKQHPWKAWALASSDGDSVNTILINVEKEIDDTDNTIFLSDRHTDKLFLPGSINMPTEQFIELCDAWQEKVAKLGPKRVIIERYLGEFFITTSND